MPLSSVLGNFGRLLAGGSKWDGGIAITRFGVPARPHGRSLLVQINSFRAKLRKLIVQTGTVHCLPRQNSMSRGASATCTNTYSLHRPALCYRASRKMLDPRIGHGSSPRTH